MINIIMKNGSFVQWEEKQYTDYMYDGKCFIVIDGSKWVGIYKIDAVRSIEIGK